MPHPPLADSPDGTRRLMLRTSGAALAGWLWLRPADAQVTPALPPLSDELAALVRRFSGNATPRTGKVTLDIAPLVDNGNTVPLRVAVDHPMGSADRVLALAVFNERNPQREVVAAEFGPLAARAELSTRMRLATSQWLVAVARLGDGSVWQQRVHVVVTLAACIEGESS